ncbi:MAG: hypothetical protein COA86_17720 [Kangiella sp.]|nr:MAG: hypothetical protein COA86_17720 [Kangiella sp.]
MKINGYYLDGQTSQRQAAFLKIDFNDKSRLKVSVKPLVDTSETEPEQTDDSEKTILFRELVISSRLGNTPREISFGNSELFVSEDNDSIDQMNEHFGNKNSFIHQLESKMTSVIVASALTVVIIWGLVVYGIPESAKFIANKMPTHLSEQFGSSLDILDKTVFDPSELDVERQTQIIVLMAPFLNQHQDLNPKINFRSGMKANALALPNGDIVFTDDFVKLVENDEQLLAVLFHELGHLKHKHLARRVLQDSMITLMVILITGDIDSIDLLTGIPTLILDLSYSREFEVEADTYALEQLHQANIPLERFSSVMQLLSDYYHDEIEEGDFASDIPNFLMTHPATKDRILMTEEFKAKLNE